ncbi:MAG: hypothetical protein PGN13_01515 [Patulibacter minatonensis]
MRRLLPAIAAFALVIAGVGGGLVILTARDQSGLQPTSSVQRPTDGPSGLPAGNVVVEFERGTDRTAIDELAAALGAVDTPATRAAGQALVSKKVVGTTGVVATTGTSTLPLADAKDPRLAAFVREHLGRTDQR